MKEITYQFMDLNFFPIALGRLFLMTLHYFTGMFLYHLWHPSFLSFAIEWISIIPSIGIKTCCSRKRKIQIFSKYIIFGWSSLYLGKGIQNGNSCCLQGKLWKYPFFYFCSTGVSVGWRTSICPSRPVIPLLCAPGADWPVGTASMSP